MKQVMIVCDGSSLGNGRQGSRAGAAALLDYRDQRRLIGEYLGQATNQQAEIVAACIGLERLKEPCRVKVISDSQYVIKTMSGYFKRKANHEFWSRLDKAAAPHRVTWEWTRGHSGHELQEKCDEAARLIATTGAVDAQKLEEILQGSMA
jgi:ribonuclease HI